MSDICGKCGGRGYLPHFSHVEGGVCFSCLGSGRKTAGRQTERQARSEAKRAREEWRQGKREERPPARSFTVDGTEWVEAVWEEELICKYPCRVEGSIIVMVGLSEGVWKSTFLRQEKWGTAKEAVKATVKALQRHGTSAEYRETLGDAERQHEAWQEHQASKMAHVEYRRWHRRR